MSSRLIFERAGTLAVALSLAGCNQTTADQQTCIDAFDHQRECGVEVPDYECPAEPTASEMCIYECSTSETACAAYFDATSSYYACLQDCL
ncbi:MAG TPA: hypothetical protein VLC09_14825 [Polyangiaceae bacterium]|nr:hypothetical protein [Polyangiaceae bacterium]